MDKSPREMSMEENLEWLLQPRPTLDASLFRQDKKLRSVLRKKLLACAERIFRICIAPYGVFELTDVVICGSADSYFYHQFSDIDIKLILKYNSQKQLFADEKGAVSFISRAISSFFKKNYAFKVNGRLVDIKAVAEAKERQLYSVLQDCWLIEPSSHIMEDVDAEKVLAHAQKIKSRIEHLFGDEFDRDLGKMDISDIFRMQAYHLKILRRKSTSAHYLLLNKLLGYDGVLARLHKFYLQSLVETLSF